jgi:phage host-nuclease inhibitor protein Gam
LDATSLGTLLLGAGAVVGAAVAYFGKKGETALSGHISLIGDLQEERDRLDRKVTDLQAENERLRAHISQQGGPPP